MPRMILLAMFVSIPSAWAQDSWESEPRDFKIEQIIPVRADTYTLPITFDVISGVLEDLGVTPTMTGNAKVGMYMEGTSQIKWPVPGGEAGDVMQEITPVIDSSYLGMDAEMGLSIAVGAKVFGNPFSFTAFSQKALFKETASAFTPFLLPYAPVSTTGTTPDTQITVRPKSTSGSIVFPLDVPIFSAGVVNLSVGLVFSAKPVSYATIYGDYLDTLITQPSGDTDTFFTDGSDQTLDGVFQNMVSLYEQADSLEVSNTWESRVGTALGYLVAVDIKVKIEVLGFPIEFQFNIFEQQFDIFPYLETSADFIAESANPATPDQAYVIHPLPMITAKADMVVFKNIGVGDKSTLKYAISNAGLLDLEATASLQGDPAFSLTPPQQSVQPGRQAGFIITFEPKTVKKYEALLIIESNDPVKPHLEIPIIANSTKQTGNGDGLIGDNGDFETSGISDFYTCGCASTSLTPGGLAPLWLLPAVVLVRRRRRDHKA